MDLTQAIIQAMKDLPQKERKEVQAMILYLAWTHNGGPKTAEIRRGEQIYKQSQHAELAQKTA